MRARYEGVLTERTRIARDMHDGLLQDLSGLALQLGAALPHVRSSPDAAADQLGRVLDEAQRLNRAARDAVLGMRVQEGSSDLVSAIHEEARRLTGHGSLALTVRVRGSPRLVPSTVRDAAVSIVHEALANVVKHASALRVRLSITFRQKRLRVAVRDDGKGMNAAEELAPATAHFGLVGMREAATSIGAELRISTAPGSGTSVSFHLPLLEDPPIVDVFGSAPST
jgi:signal transduction histidine kinase